MRKLIVVSCGLWVVGGVLFVNHVLGQTITTVPQTTNTTPTPTPSSELIEKLKQIEVLKEKIATRVSQLRENEKVAILGTIAASSSASLTIKTPDSQEKKVSFLDDTQFYRMTSGKRSTISAGNITTSAGKLAASATVTVFGYYNEDRSVITAKYVYEITESSEAVIGKINEVNKNDYTVSITNGKDMKVFDYEKTTRTNALNDTQTSFVKSGFSKLKVGDTVRVIGQLNSESENRRTAQTFYILISPPQLTATQEKEKTTTPSANIKSTEKPTAQPTKSS